MTSSEVACSYFLKIKPYWRVCVMDSDGLSRGKLVFWNPDEAEMKAFSTFVGILMMEILKVLSTI